MKNGKGFFLFFTISYLDFFFRVTSVRYNRCLCEIETAILNFIALFVSLFFCLNKKFILAFVLIFQIQINSVNNIYHY